MAMTKRNHHAIMLIKRLIDLCQQHTVAGHFRRPAKGAVVTAVTVDVVKLFNVFAKCQRKWTTYFRLIQRFEIAERLLVCGQGQTAFDKPVWNSFFVQ